VVNATPRPLYPPGKRPNIHCIGGWEGIWAGMEGPYLVSIPGPSDP